MNNILFSEDRLSMLRASPVAYYQKRARRLILPLAAIGFFACSLLFFTFVHVGTLITGYHVASLEAKQDALLRELQALKLEEAVLKRPERIRKIAQERLDLIPGSKAPILRVP